MPANNKQISIVDIQLAAWREQMLNRLLPITTALATAGIILGIISVVERERWLYIPVYVGVYLALVLITVFRRLPYRTRATALLIMIAIMGVAVLSETGLSGEGRPFLLTLPIAAMALLGWSQSLLGLGFSTASLLIFGWLANHGMIVIQSPGQTYSSSFVAWGLAATLTAMLVTGVIMSLRASLQNLISTVQDEQRARQQLRDVSDHLEHKIADRSDKLARAASQLAFCFDLGRAFANQQDPDAFLQQAAGLLVQKMDLHQVSVYLLDPHGKHGELCAAAGDSAARMLAEGSRIEIDKPSLVGWCLADGKARTLLDGDHPPTPLPPGTRSAMVLPLRTGARLLGVVEIHSRAADAFGKDAMAAYQEMVDQVAAMLDRIRQLGRVQDPPPAPPEPGRRAGKLTLPVRSNGNEIGRLVVEPPADSASWSVSQVEFLQQLADRAAIELARRQPVVQADLGLDSAHQMTEITSRIRASLDPDTILKTTVRELGRALGARLATIEVADPHTSTEASAKPGVPQGGEE